MPAKGEVLNRSRPLKKQSKAGGWKRLPAPGFAHYPREDALHCREFYSINMDEVVDYKRDCLYPLKRLRKLNFIDKDCCDCYRLISDR